jgi:hypothetical protein
LQKKVISFSLWENRGIYTYGAIENAKMAPEIYPGWETSIVIHKDVDKRIVPKIKEVFDSVTINDMDNPRYHGLFWRFEAMLRDDVDVCVFRDCDGRLCDKEFQAVKEWLDSDKQIHAMRDDVNHFEPIHGGMWGVKKAGPVNLRLLYRTIKKYDSGMYDSDQIGLKRAYNGIKENILAHDDRGMFDGKRFPSHKPFRYGSCIGEPISVNDDIILRDRP